MFDIPKNSAPTASAAGWHVAHIFAVKDGNTDYERWSRRDVIRRFVRNIHPCNYFLIPKTDWQQWGGDPRVIGYFAELYRQRYSDIWSEFLRLADASDSVLARVTGPVSYSYPATAGQAPNPRAVRTPIRAPLQKDDVTEYRAARLTFKRDVIEPLDLYDVFRVVAPVGTFQMTKGEFYQAFPKVPLTRSYREAGCYNFPKVPKAAEASRISTLQ